MSGVQLRLLTPRARAAIAASAVIARSNGVDHIGAEHLLAALLRMEGVYGRESSAESTEAALTLAESLEAALANSTYRAAATRQIEEGADADAGAREPDVLLRSDPLGNWRLELEA